MAETNQILLVDGYAHIYRSFFAVRGLTSPEGRPTNALYGVARYLMKLEESFPHTHGAFVMDRGKPVDRLELLPEYKANRAPMPDDLRSQVSLIQEWVEAAGWPILIWEGHEADDLIAAVVQARDGHGVLIFSGDKDLAQLVQPGVQLMLPGKKGAFVELDSEGVREKFGVPPERVIDYLALVGDSADNIAGVEGVGAKTAVKLLCDYGSIEGILANAHTVSRPSLQQKLTHASELLERNRKLVTLDSALPPNWTGLDAIERRRPDWGRLIELSRECGFKSLTSTLEERRDADRSPTLFDF